VLGGAIELPMNPSVTHILFLASHLPRRFVGQFAQVGFLRSPKIASSEWKIANGFPFAIRRFLFAQ
jgi:hypothetical protein